MNTLTYIQLQRKEKERAELQRIADWIEDNPGITAAEAMRDSGQTYYRLRSIDHLLTRKKNNEGPNEKVLLYRNDKPFSMATKKYGGKPPSDGKLRAPKVRTPHADPTAQFQCTCCGTVKIATEFYTNRTPDQHSAYCIACIGKYGTIRRDAQKLRRRMEPRPIKHSSKLEIPLTTLTRWVPGTLYARNSVY